MQNAAPIVTWENATPANQTSIARPSGPYSPQVPNFAPSAFTAPSQPSNSDFYGRVPSERGIPQTPQNQTQTNFQTPRGGEQIYQTPQQPSQGQTLGHYLNSMYHPSQNGEVFQDGRYAQSYQNGGQLSNPIQAPVGNILSTPVPLSSSPAFPNSQLTQQPNSNGYHAVPAQLANGFSGQQQQQYQQYQYQQQDFQPSAGAFQKTAQAPQTNYQTVESYQSSPRQPTQNQGFQSTQTPQSNQPNNHSYQNQPNQAQYQTQNNQINQMYQTTQTIQSVKNPPQIQIPGQQNSYPSEPNTPNYQTYQSSFGSGANAPGVQTIRYSRTRTHPNGIVEHTDGRVQYTEVSQQTPSTITYQDNGSRPSLHGERVYTRYDHGSDFVGQSRTIGEVRVTNERAGDLRVVEERIGEGRIVDVREGRKSILRETQLEAVVKSERVTVGETRVISEVELGREKRGSVHTEVRVEAPQIETVRQQKIIEVVREKPVAIEKVVEVPYDVIVDIPVERTIEREKFIDILVERPIEKVVEIPVEEIIEIPIEKIIEKPIEIQKLVEVPVQRVVEKPYEVLKENVRWRDRVIDVDESQVGRYPNASILPTQVDYRHQDRVIERPKYVENVVDMPVTRAVERYIDVPRERIVEKKVPVYIDRPYPVEKVVRNTVEVPVERPVYRDVEQLVERPKYVENIIELPVPVENIIERVVEIPIEHLVEKPVYIDNIIKKPIDHIVEIPVPIEQIIEVPIEQVIEVPLPVERARPSYVEKLIRQPKMSVRKVEVPYEQRLEVVAPKHIEQVVDRKVYNYRERPVERIIERPVYIERMVERPVEIERVVEVPVESVREVLKTVEKITEKPVHYDTVIEKEVEVLIEKVIEVPVEKLIEVEVEITVEKPVVKEVFVEQEIYIETERSEFNRDFRAEELDVEEFDDPEVQREINLRRHELQQDQGENERLRRHLEDLRARLQVLRNSCKSPAEAENLDLFSRYVELKSRVKNVHEENELLQRKKRGRKSHIEYVMNKDRRVDPLKRRLEALVDENHQLCAMIKDKGENTRKSVRYSQYRH